MNAKCKSYSRYGGRGIKVCERWSTFKTFLADLGPKPSPEFEIERINNDLGYEPGNVRWASPFEQAQNTSMTHLLTYKGVSLPLTEWARRTKLKRTTLHQRINSGWTTEQALEAPVGQRRFK